MRVRRASIVVAALLIALPTSLASSPFAATALLAEGSTTLGGTAAAVFFPVAESGLSWDATAASATLHRKYAEWTAFDERALPVGVGRMRLVGDTVEEEVQLGELAITGDASRPFGALFAGVGEGALDLVATSMSLLRIETKSDPRFDEGAPPTAAQNDDDLAFEVHEQLSGEFLTATLQDGVIELRGDVTLRLFDVDYRAGAGDAVTLYRTGDVEDARTGPYATGRIETHTLTLIDAVLHLRAPTETIIASQRATIAVEGALRAEGASGALDVPTLAPLEPGRWTGVATLDLSPRGGVIGVASPAPLAPVDAVTSRASQLVRLALAGAALAALSIVVFVLVRRRARAAAQGDLDAAILAMEDRRWGDALPHLERLAAARPDDASLLMDRAICLEGSGRLDEARAGYEDALRVQPHNAEAHYYYARTLARMRLGTAALAHLSRALTLDPRLGELARGESAFSLFRDHPQFRGLVR